MSNTPNLDLELVPSNSLQPSVPINASLQTLDALCQIGVEGVLNDPPATTVENDLGKMWIVGPTPTGVFVGHTDAVALCTGENLFLFFAAGTQVKYLFRKDTFGFYMYASAWVLAGGLGDAPVDGTAYVRKDGGWVAEAGGGGTGVVETIVPGAGITVDSTDPANPVVSVTGGVDIIIEAGAATMVPATHSGQTKLILAGGDVTFAVAEGYVAGDVFNIRATTALALVESGVLLEAPAGGTLNLDSGMTVTVVMLDADTGLVIGQTVAI